MDDKDRIHIWDQTHSKDAEIAVRVNDDQNNKMVSSLCPKLNRKNKQLRCVMGYCRDIQLQIGIPEQIINIIIKYWDFMSLYLQVSSSKHKPKELGFIQYKEIDMEYFYENNEFVKSKCQHCTKKDCLEYKYSDIENKQKYSLDIVHCDDQFAANYFPKWINNMNIYQCSLCKYFVIYNVKSNVLNDWYNGIGGGGTFVTPFRCNADTFQLRMESEYACGQCEGQYIGLRKWQSVALKGYGYESDDIATVIYCNLCDIFALQMSSMCR